MEISAVRVGDNYTYLLESAGVVAVIDPTSADAVISELGDRQLDLVLATHEHHDHTAGRAALLKRYGAGSPDDSSIEVGEDVLEVLSVPGHTTGDVAFYCAAAGAVFTGDVLFVGGCGRVFSGDYAAMWTSLKTLRALPDDTRVFCGHDYTVDNLQFAISVEPSNELASEKLTRLKGGESPVPSTIAEEKATNPFFRCDDPEFQRAAELQGMDPEGVFREIRTRKDAW